MKDWVLPLVILAIAFLWSVWRGVRWMTSEPYRIVRHTLVNGDVRFYLQSRRHYPLHVEWENEGSFYDEASARAMMEVCKGLEIEKEEVL